MPRTNVETLEDESGNPDQATILSILTTKGL